jgi:proline iminopeptidase
MRRFFDPRRWRAILFDQRGAGRSTPLGGLIANTTQHLVDDIEKLRRRAGVDAWAVFGGSWGSTLALAYAEAYPERVLGLILRGIFLFTPSEIDWFYRGGVSRLLPDAWERFLAPLAPSERRDPVSAYHRVLIREDYEARRRHVEAWTDWETAALGRAYSRWRAVDRQIEPAAADALARIECNYMAHEGFMPSPDALMDGVARIAGLPCTIVQGRLDLVTPPEAAWRLAQAWPGARLTIVEGAGHSAMEPGLADGLVRACDELAAKLG